MMLLVVAGHGAGDSGAVGGGYTEAERVRHLAARIKALGGDSVVVGNIDVNWYASGWMNRAHVPAGAQVLELHMDSAGAGARGGHVEIKQGFAPDAYDAALAEFVSWMFPGRAQKIRPRSDLKNMNDAAANGISYRLLECCFISNPGDLAKFNERTDELARGILAAFGIEEKGDGMAAPADVWEYRYGGSDNCFNALHEASREILRKDDPSGRGMELTTHEHVKWIAAKQADIAERLERIEAALTRSEQDGKVTGELN